MSSPQRWSDARRSVKFYSISGRRLVPKLGPFPIRKMMSSDTFRVPRVVVQVWRIIAYEVRDGAIRYPAPITLSPFTDDTKMQRNIMGFLRHLAAQNTDRHRTTVRNRTRIFSSSHPLYTNIYINFIDLEKRTGRPVCRMWPGFEGVALCQDQLLINTQNLYVNTHVTSYPKMF